MSAARTINHGPDGPIFEGFPVATLAEWRAEGERLFGKDVRLWRFVCPVCKGVQTLADFEALPDKQRPVVPLRVFYYSCIGRWLPNPRGGLKLFGDPGLPPTPESHCDYTHGGLFCLATRVVTHEDGHNIPVFAFDAAVPV